MNFVRKKDTTNFKQEAQNLKDDSDTGIYQHFPSFLIDELECTFVILFMLIQPIPSLVKIEPRYVIEGSLYYSLIGYIDYLWSSIFVWN